MNKSAIISTSSVTETMLTPKLRGRKRGGGSSVTANVTIPDTEAPNSTLVAVDTDDMQGQRTAVAIAEAEQRAKHSVGDFMACFDWDINSDVDITSNTYHPLDFDHEVLNCDGVYNRGGVWFFRVPERLAGRWWLHARVQVQIPALANAVRAQLGFWRGNDNPVTLVDEHNAAWSGNVPMLNALLCSGRHLSLKGGDLLQCVIRIQSAPGTATYAHPTSIVGYIGGHRVSCDHTEIDSPDNQTSFTFGA